jgi:hypothetical protein
MIVPDVNGIFAGGNEGGILLLLADPLVHGACEATAHVIIADVLIFLHQSGSMGNFDMSPCIGTVALPKVCPFENGFAF